MTQSADDVLTSLSIRSGVRDKYTDLKSIRIAID